jgi:XTP/dITP diphosphohydrolase
MALSDDSGLCIQSLKGFPGVRTKEFTVECGGILKAFEEVQRLLANAGNTRAYYHASVALCHPGNPQVLSAEAQENGHLTFPPRGAGSEGYDPVFIPEGYDQTLAELGLSVKNTISHRALALRALIQQAQVQGIF